MLKRSFCLSFLLGTLCLSILPLSVAYAHDSWGHKVIEAAAYKHLLSRTQIPELGNVSGRDVIITLVRYGILDPPIGDDTTKDLFHSLFPKDSSSYTLLDYLPQIKSGGPDVLIDRQFADNGQLFHFMAFLQDIDRKDSSAFPLLRPDLLLKAYPRCLRFLTGLTYQILLDKLDSKARREGIYELVHSIADSYSGAHVERDTTLPGWNIKFLYVWEATAMIRGARQDESMYYHGFPHDVRDNQFLKSDSVSLNGKIVNAQNIDSYLILADSLTQRSVIAAYAIEDLFVTLYRLLQYDNHTIIHADHRSATPQDSIWRAYLRKYYSSTDDKLNAENIDTMLLDVQPVDERKWSPVNSIGGRIRGNKNGGDVGVVEELETPWIFEYPFPLTSQIEFGFRQEKQNGRTIKKAYLSTSMMSSAINIPITRFLNISFCPLVMDLTSSSFKFEDANADFLWSLKADFLFSRKFRLGYERPRYSYKYKAFDGFGALTVMVVLTDAKSEPLSVKEINNVRIDDPSLLATFHYSKPIFSTVSNFISYDKFTENGNSLIGIPLANFLKLADYNYFGVGGSAGVDVSFLIGPSTSPYTLREQVNIVDRLTIIDHCFLEVLPAQVNLKLSPKVALETSLKPVIGVSFNYLFYDFSVMFGKWSRLDKFDFSFYGFRIGVLEF